MVNNKIYQELEKDFTSTFIHELIPGVLHNFANPLNGIMGRSKLLQRRIDDALKKMKEQYPEAANGLQDEFQRIGNDIRSINRESDSFFEIFRSAAGKFYALAARGNERINLSQLMAAEIHFSDFYLEFKHEIKKNIQLDQELPEIQGNMAELSLSFWRLIRFAMSRTLKSEGKEFFLKTEYDKNNILIYIAYDGESVSEEENNFVSGCLENNMHNLSGSTLDQGVLLALILLKKYPVQVHFFTENGKNVMELTLSYRNIKN